MKKGLKIVLSILAVLLLIAFFTVKYISLQMGKAPDGKEFEHLSYYENGQFISPEELVYFPENKISYGGRTGWDRWIFRTANVPKKPLPKINLTKKSFAEQPDSLAIYWLGHSSAIVEIAGKRLLIDPVFGNAGPFWGIARRFCSPPLKRRDLPKIDYVVITHNHYDHLEYATIRRLRKKNVHFIVPLGVDAHLRGWGVAPEKITRLGWEDSFADEALKITALPAIHYSSRSRNDRNATLWVSYIFEGADKKVFWSGDAGYGDIYSDIGEKYGPFDVAAIEMDAWNPGWPNTHFFPHEVIKVAEEIRTKIIIPIHWAVFDLAMQPWDKSIKMLYELAQETDNIELATPMMGEKYIPGITQTTQWW